MTSEILNQARIHLLEFVEKVEDQIYTRSEYENFLLMGYQTPDLEKIRTEVCNIIAVSNKQPGNPAISDENRKKLHQFIDLLKNGEFQGTGIK